MVATRSGPKIWRMALVNVVFPDPLSPATPIIKTRGDRAMISLKLRTGGMCTCTFDAIGLKFADVRGMYRK